MLSAYISMVDTPTEKELVTQLYNSYKQFMYNISMSMLGKREDTEDAVQDSFIRIINNLDKIGNPYSRKTKSYITVITKNICVDKLRKYNINNTLAIGDSVEDIPDDNEETDIAYEQVIKNMKQLPPRLKSIAFLYYVQKLPTDNISQMLDIEVNTIHVYLSRIRKILLSKKGTTL